MYNPTFTRATTEVMALRGQSPTTRRESLGRESLGVTFARLGSSRSCAQDALHLVLWDGELPHSPLVGSRPCFARLLDHDLPVAVILNQLYDVGVIQLLEKCHLIQ